MAEPDVHSKCQECGIGRDFKIVDERDAHDRALMACTKCGHKQPIPGQVKARTEPINGT